jgi:tripartite-type tricarboxylate transporter receptor subunit TctC
MRRYALAVAALLATAPFVAAQDFPTQPVRMIVGFNPGGGMDTIARTVSDKLAAPLGQPVVVENRPGAGGTIAMAFTKEARADGYTIVLSETSALIGPVIYDNVGYDPIADFTPVAQLTSAPLALVANPKLGIDTVSGLIELAKSKPGELFYATSGVATVQHLAGEILSEMAGIDLEDAPFQGGAPSVTAVVSGEVPLAIVSLGAAVQQAEGGAVKILGITSAERLPQFPDLPTISETIAGFTASPSQFIMAPSDAPAAAIKALSDAVGKAMEEQALLDTLTKQGFIPNYKSGEQLASEIPDEVKRWTDATKALDPK